MLFLRLSYDIKHFEANLSINLITVHNTIYNNLFMFYPDILLFGCIYNPDAKKVGTLCKLLVNPEYKDL